MLIAARFELAPPKRLVPKTSALDHSATLPVLKHTFYYTICENNHFETGSCNKTITPVITQKRFDFIVYVGALVI